jgi:hypothetical protein
MAEDLIKKIIGNILGPHPKKDIYVKNSRHKKKHKRSDSCVDGSDPDAHQGSAKESERRED